MIPLKKLLTILFILLLAGCSKDTTEADEIAVNQAKDAVLQDVINLHKSISFYCLDDRTCQEDQDLSINDIWDFYTAGSPESPYFHELWYEVDYDTIIATYTSEGIYIFLEATGDNLYEFDGLIVNPNDLSKDDILTDTD